MSKINVLDENTINLIAAGEVVEKPASVVKELVENAMDSGADTITIEIKQGGIEFIRITDNGSGIERDDIKTAFLRHATSKIKDANDLLLVASMGFRGEALSSISAVAKVELITKTRSDLMGNRYTIEGGREGELEEVGAPNGTTIIVRNLFYNTPARRKFLKSEMAEGNAIGDVVQHLALGRPDISFKYIVNNKVKLQTTGKSDVKEIIYRIYGKEISDEIIPISYEEDGNTINGYLGTPAINRANRNYETFFVNNRYIQSSTISSGIEEGYREYLMQHKFPFCVLHIDMEFTALDVNVHPAKLEVRFNDNTRFQQFVARAIAHTLKNREMISKVSFEDEVKTSVVYEKTPEQFESARITIDDSAMNIIDISRVTADIPKSKQSEDIKSEPVTKEDRFIFSVDFEDDDLELEESNAEESGFDDSDAKDSDVKESVVKDLSDKDLDIEDLDIEDLDIEDSDILDLDIEDSDVLDLDVEDSDVLDLDVEDSDVEDLDVEDLVVEVSDLEDSETKDLKTEETEGKDLKLDESKNAKPEQLSMFEEDRVLSKEARRRYKLIGHVFDAYWIMEYADSVYFIDQHAAHEKVNYERIMKRVESEEKLTQYLNPPIVVSLSMAEKTVFSEHEEYFNKLGFECEDFGGNEVALTGIPSELYFNEPRDMFLSILDDLDNSKRTGTPKVIMERIATMACKASVKGGRKISYEEMQELIDEMLTLDNPYHCPHGRPTIFTMSRYELEKKFKRIVD